MSSTALPEFKPFATVGTDKEKPIIRRRTQHPESFGTRTDGYKPAVSAQYHPPQSSVPAAYVYPQSYAPIYIPIIVQSCGTSLPGAYPGATSPELLTGMLKFFDEVQDYGFFTMDCDGTDLFVHYDDLLKSGITKEYLMMAKAMNVRFAFRCVSYYGKYNLSYKAVDIQPLQESVFVAAK